MNTWLDMIKTLAPWVTAGIAFVALKSWQKQDKAKREAEFLVDTLLEATHTYVAEMQRPISLLEHAKTGMLSYEPTRRSGEQSDRAVKGAVAYIEENGEREAKRLSEALAAVQPSAIRLWSLVAKGQVFRFDRSRGAHIAFR
jgi:hypothetical protein